MTIAERIAELVAAHGSLREVARVLDMDVSYLWRLSAGQKTNPLNVTLRKLGLGRVVTYERSKPAKRRSSTSCFRGTDK